MSYSAAEGRKIAMENLEDVLDSIRTHPNITTLLLQATQNKRNHPYDLQVDGNIDLGKTIREQLNIGWNIV